MSHRTFAGDKGGAVVDLLRVRRLFAGEQVARLGHSGPGGRTYLAPVRFAVIDDGDAGVIVCALEGLPNSLAVRVQIRAIPAAPAVTLLVDGTRPSEPTWWVRADAVAEVLRPGTGDPRFAMGLRALVERYEDSPEPLAEARSIIWGTVTAWNGWTAAVDSVSVAA